MSIYDHLEFRLLKYIVAIAEEGSFTSAALTLPVAQSALSRQIGELEDVYGIHIFDRTHGGANLTPTGQALVGFARDLLKTRVEVVDAIQAIEQSTFLPLRLGFCPFVEEKILEMLSQSYRDLFPKGIIRPESGNPDDLLVRLHEGELDAALLTLPLDTDELCVQKIMHEKLAVCLRKDDPLASKEAISPVDLNGKLSIFCDPRYHPLAHARLLKLLKEQGITPKLSSPTFNVEHIQWMVREGLCYALIREHAQVQDDLTIRRILGVNWTVDSALIYRPDSSHRALPLLIRDLEKRFTVAEVSLKKRPPISVTHEANVQGHLAFENHPPARVRTKK